MFTSVALAGSHSANTPFEHRVTNYTHNYYNKNTYSVCFIDERHGDDVGFVHVALDVLLRGHLLPLGPQGVH